ncbi:MAG: hypothetical protein JSS38_18950 [Nitrospira sp.]|nr:hypothetical protein [Nitrospira sp.]
MVAAPDLVVQQVVHKGHLARPKRAKGGRMPFPPTHRLCQQAFAKTVR